MADVSRFFHRTQSPSRGPYETEQLVVDTEGYVFLRGSSNIGVGTKGIGERDQEGSSSSPNRQQQQGGGGSPLGSPSDNSANYSPSASQRLKDQKIREYINDRRELHAQWKAKESQRVQSVLADKMNARIHMHQAMEKHRMEIVQMGIERKRQEDEAKREREKEADELKTIFKEKNERFLKERKEATKQRELQKQYEAEALRKKRAELAEIEQAEKEISEREKKERIIYLQEAAKKERARMKASKAKRDIYMHDSVQEMRHEQDGRVQKRDVVMKEIVELKHELCDNVREHIKNERLIGVATRYNVIHKSADELRKKEKELEEERDQRKEDRIAAAKELREERTIEAQQRKEAYEEAKAKQKSLLQLQAKEQKLRARRAIDNEREEKYKQTQDYISACRSLVSRHVSSEHINNEGKRALLLPSESQQHQHGAAAAHDSKKAKAAQEDDDY